VTCALLMAMASLQVIREASTELLNFWHNGEAVYIDLKVLDVVLMAATVGTKLGLYYWCRAVYARTSNVTVEAVAQDNLNDVLSNAAAILAALSTQVRTDLWICDPAGALIISLYIVWSWAKTGVEQVEMIVGKTASSEFLDVVREMAETHDPNVTLDVVRAYHFGPKFLVEIEIVMPEDTPLRESHDAGILLQHKIESLDEVERCFVHIDYQVREVDDHDPNVPVEYKTAEAHTLPRIKERGGGAKSAQPARPSVTFTPEIAVHPLSPIDNGAPASAPGAAPLGRGNSGGSDRWRLPWGGSGRT